MRWTVLRDQILGLPLWIVGENELDRTQYSHDTRCILVQLITYTVFKHRVIDRTVALGNPDLLTERTHCRRRVAAAAHTGDRRHTRIVPAAHVPSLDEFTQLTLARDRPREIEPCKLDLTRTRPCGKTERLEQPVVEWAVLLKLKRAQGVRNALNGI